MGLTMSLWFAVFARMRKILWLDFPMEGARGLFIRHWTGLDELERHGRLVPCSSHNYGLTEGQGVVGAKRGGLRMDAYVDDERQSPRPLGPRP